MNRVSLNDSPWMQPVYFGKRRDTKKKFDPIKRKARNKMAAASRKANRRN